MSSAFCSFVCPPRVWFSCLGLGPSSFFLVADCDYPSIACLLSAPSPPLSSRRSFLDQALTLFRQLHGSSDDHPTARQIIQLRNNLQKFKNGKVGVYFRVRPFLAFLHRPAHF